MSLTLLLTGIAKIAAGLAVGVAGVLIGFRLLNRWLGTTSHADAVREGNVAVSILKAASLLSLAVMVRQAVVATFSALDYLTAAGAGGGALWIELALYFAVHVGSSLILGSTILGLGAVLFNRLTPGVDEVEAVRRGEVGPALVLGAILLLLAYVTAPGLETALSGLMPLPELPPGTYPAPS